MRIFWHQGGLHIEPEGESERNLLVEIVQNLKVGKPPEMQRRIPSGCSASGSEDLFKALVANHEASPSSLPTQSHDEKQVVGVNVGLQIVPKFDSGPSSF
jgi:hypothetical protein